MQLIVPITAIINLSMRERVVPPDFKQALVTPLIKKKTLCRNEFKNYRQISNLRLSVKNTGEDCSQTRKCTHRRSSVIEPCTICL